MICQIKEKFKKGEIDKQEFINQMYESNHNLFEYVSLIKDTGIEAIEIIDNGLIFTSRDNKLKFFCDQNDKRSAPFEILNFDTYESEDSELMYNLINDSDTIFDIGGNIGWYTLNFSKKYPNSKIYSFEPVPSTFAQLEYNLALNKLSNIEINNFGFSNEDKSIEFYVSNETSVSSSAQNLSNDPDIKKIICKVITLDSYIQKSGKSVDFIKCDVEGAELFVYQGGYNTLKIQKPIVFSEMLRKWSAKFDYHPNDIIQLFKTLDYKCFIISKKTYLKEITTINDDTLETNFVFLHIDKHNKIIEKYV